MEPTEKSSLTVNAADREVILRREMDAPRSLVYRVYTDPDLIPEWWGPANLTTTVEQMDVRPGGAWRFVQRDPQGEEYAFHGEYREADAPERLVFTFVFDGAPDAEILETVTFEERDGRTTVTARDQFRTKDDLRGMLDSGMEDGAVETFERLAALVSRVRRQERK